MCASPANGIRTTPHSGESVTSAASSVVRTVPYIGHAAACRLPHEAGNCAGGSTKACFARL